MRQTGEWIHGKYQVLRVLGAGGMGVVYATKRRNESMAAVKVLHPRFARDKSIRARFLEEGYLANRVGHPAVVTILEDDIDEAGNFYIVMELLDGVDLGKFVGPPRTPMTTAQVLNITDQLLTALVQAHQKGIVHRDIKPSNVMILRDGRIKLLDFGIAKALHSDGTVSPVEDDEEETIGTDRYMSPEQGNGFFEDIDARSDLWSVGALMMALLADGDDSSVPLWDQSYEDRAWSFSRMGQDVPPHVVQIISLALQPQKTKRWVSAAAMRDAVRAAHVDLYGPPTSEQLSVLAKAQLPSSSEALAPVPAGSDPKPLAAPVVIDPTFPSRPSQPPPTPRALRRDELSVASATIESPAPPVVATRGRAWGGWRSLGWGVLLFALGVAVTLVLTSQLQRPHESPSQAAEPSPSHELPPKPEQAPAEGIAQDASVEIDVGDAPRDPLQEGLSHGPALKTNQSLPKRNTEKGTTPVGRRPPSPAAPPKPGRSGEQGPGPAPTPAPRCNGLDGIFNVEGCE